MPVVESVPPVMGDLEEPLCERLGRDHLAARGHDQPLELAQQPTGIAVGGDDDAARVELRGISHTTPLDEHGPRRGGLRRESPHPAGGLQHAVGGMVDRSGEAALERRQKGARPTPRRSPSAQSASILVPELLALLAVGSEAQAAPPSERIARQRLQRVDLALCPAPEPRAPARGRSTPRPRRTPRRCRAARSRRSGRSRPRRSRARRPPGRASPASASASAQAQPVTPAPTIPTSTGPPAPAPGGVGAGSSSQ